MIFSVSQLLQELFAPFWIVLSPFVAFGLFAITLIALVVNGFCRRGRLSRKEGAIFLSIVLMLGVYMMFNAYDLYRYRKFGLAISPINQSWYFLFLPPPDLYESCVVIPLAPQEREYEAEYRHRYGGAQEIVLNLVNIAPKEFDYDNPDKINLNIKSTVTCVETGKKKEYERGFTSYFLSPRTNHLVLCQYEVSSIEALSKTYRVDLKIDGRIDEFLDKYPGSYLTINNGTTK